MRPFKPICYVIIYVQSCSVCHSVRIICLQSRHVIRIGANISLWISNDLGRISHPITPGIPVVPYQQGINSAHTPELNFAPEPVPESPLKSGTVNRLCHWYRYQALSLVPITKMCYKSYTRVEYINLSRKYTYN